MNKWEKAVDKFIDEKNYLTNYEVLGIILHGSYVTGYNHEYSDIDLLIIKVPFFDSYAVKFEMFLRGASIIDGYKIEYFEKPINYFYSTMRDNFKRGDYGIYNIVYKGKVLFDPDGEIENLKRILLQTYKQVINSNLKMDEETAKQKICIIENKIQKLYGLYKQNDKGFMINYYNMLTYIQRFYSLLIGVPDIPLDKLTKLYVDKNYSNIYIDNKIPDEEFIKLLLNCLEPTNKKEALESINELYTYIRKDIDINPKQYTLFYDRYK